MGKRAKGIWNTDRVGSGDNHKPVGTVDATDPIPEKVVGVVFPYRGMEQHGVKAKQPDFPDDEIESDKYDVEKEPEPVTPIPVFIVNRSGNERRTIRTAQLLVGTNSVRIVPRNDSRTKVRIKNCEATAGFTVWIGGEQTLTGATYDGYPLAPGESIDTVAEDEIFAVSDGQGAGGVNRIAILQELTVNLG